MLAGKGKLSARYQRKGENFDAKASAELRELRLDGLPMAGRIDRDLVTPRGDRLRKRDPIGLAERLAGALARGQERPGRVQGPGGPQCGDGQCGDRMRGLEPN